MKKLMLLGGLSVLIPVIETAHKLGIYVITCDYLPDNDAHAYSDEFVNVSTMDKEKVLAEAIRLQIDGIMSFACDSGVVTAAYVAEKMNLPFQCSYEAAKILQDKGEFRKFLRENGFNCPNAKKYNDVEEPFNDIEYFNWPVIVKPTDSAGSKGVTRVDNVADLRTAINTALDEAHNGEFIIEDFLEFEGYHSSADYFSIDGKLAFSSFSDQLFDAEAKNPYTPSLIIWPTTMKKKYQNQLIDDIQKVFSLLQVKTGIYNIETCVAGGNTYIMEISPRGGGCKIAELQKLAYGVNLIEAEIKNAVGMPIGNIKQTECNGYWCEMVVHSDDEIGGVLEKLWIDPEFEKKYIKVKAISVERGDKIEPFTGGNKALGDLIMRFENRERIESHIVKQSDWLKVYLE